MSGSLFGLPPFFFRLHAKATAPRSGLSDFVRFDCKKASGLFLKSQLLSEIPSRVACRWQAAKWLGAVSSSGGSSAAHFGIANGQRVWKRQPLGGLSGEGTSPASTISSSGRPGRGGRTAENSAFV